MSGSLFREGIVRHRRIGDDAKPKWIEFTFLNCRTNYRNRSTTEVSETE